MAAINNAYEVIFIISIIIFALLICFCLGRVIKGPTIADRIVGVNMIGTMTNIIIAILSALLKESYLLDVCLIYAMISFLAVVVLTKVYQGAYRERMEKREKKEKLQETLARCEQEEDQVKEPTIDKKNRVSSEELLEQVEDKGVGTC